MATYATLNDAIHREIITPLGEWAHHFNIDAIAERFIYTRPRLQRRRQHHGRRRACGDPKRLRREHKTTACCCRPKETGTHRTDTRTCVHCVGIHPVHRVEEVNGTTTSTPTAPSTSTAAALEPAPTQTSGNSPKTTHCKTMPRRVAGAYPLKGD